MKRVSHEKRQKAQKKIGQERGAGLLDCGLRIADCELLDRAGVEPRMGDSERE